MSSDRFYLFKISCTLVTWNFNVLFTTTRDSVLCFSLFKANTLDALSTQLENKVELKDINDYSYLRKPECACSEWIREK